MIKSEEPQNPSKLREIFRQHYSILRDIVALHNGIGEIAAGSIDEKTQKDYSALCSITSDEVKSWSANRVLVVSNESDEDEDGALRLYETKVGESKCTEVLSRSLICLDLSGGNGVSSVLCDLDEHYVYVSYEDF
jgi:hypothetical protein